MKFATRHPAIIATALIVCVLLGATSGRAQEGRKNRDDSNPIKLRIPFPLRPFGSGMTPIDPPSAAQKPGESQPSVDPPVVAPSQPQRIFLRYEKTPKGTLQRFSDGSTLELRADCNIETLCNGTKIETLLQGTTIVRWPNGGGVIRNPDGTGAEFKPDPRDPSRSGDLSEILGTIEVLPGGVVRQTLKDEGAVLDRYPDGTIRSRPDLVKPEAKPTTPGSSRLLIPMVTPTITTGADKE